MALVLLIILSVFLQGAIGELVCEDLPVELCSFAISSEGKRCSLEKYKSRDEKSMEFECKTSEVVVNEMKEYIENNECIRACGLDRKSVGISSDILMEPRFVVKICSTQCYHNCPNILDLHTNLALAEGVDLPAMCKVLQESPRRAMSQLLSSGEAAYPSYEALAPISDSDY